ncbi:hypothetical protein [Bradyrhizobium betae]|uniref:Uncharacterized protein n=1 Tax=Bradyrhizobium betae TaxID=244734 RepID=A0A5P6NYS9_9BRAD|nr:hypothetical protein [Bradyrhizobium betae]MCS3725512.1 hypothetical protein [Bradyrhizobium betae]QFI71200.1 hypothetical protein F8237_01720 [Bradyrhizobium betae]
MTLPANIRVATSVPFPSQVKGRGAVAIAKANGVWTVSLNFAALLPAVQFVPSPATTYVLAWDSVADAFYLVQLAQVAGNKVVRVLAAAGPYAAQPGDDVLIVKQLAGAPFNITVDWSVRTKPLTIVDGKGDANVNNITITPGAGQTQMATVNYVYTIDGAGGSITLTPLPDGTGAY